MEPFDLSDLALPAIICLTLLGLYLLSKVWKRNLKRKHGGRLVEMIFHHLHAPVEILMILTALYAAVESLQFRWTENPVIRQAYVIAAMAGVAWLAVRAIYIVSDLMLRRFDVTRKDNYRARMVHTQVKVLRRLVISIVVLLALSSILMTFSEIRSLGVSLLASAGVAGIVIGFAAQKTIGNFFTGFQIAITQPIRIDDVVVVEGEWGRIEEINLTYVVVKIWDERRLILPIAYFVDKPFQNWTRKTADILGTVMLYADYGLPVQPIRDELDRMLDGNPLWDGKVKVVQVTDITKDVMEIRILVSAVDSGTAFDLRCAIREGMINFIRKNYPDHFPKLRAQLAEERAATHRDQPDPTVDPVRAPAPTLEAEPKPMTSEPRAPDAV